ncbi:Pisatin demethylase [Beauveria bassiana]|nr:Pisatin demethylase [Beauveria bassiana]
MGNMSVIMAIESAYLLRYPLGAIVLALATLLMAVITHRLFLGPFSHIPGPRLAAVSSIWYAYHARNGTTAAIAKRLHRRYGPVVRVGPKEVWFNTKEAYDHIYSTGIRGYEKSDFYLATALTRPRIDWRLHASFDDNLDLLSETDMNRYRLQRRLIGRVYRTANAVRHEQAVDKVMDEVIRKFDSIDGAEIDLKEWMHIISVESLGAMVLSWSPGMIKAGTDRATSYQSYLGWRRKSVFGLFPLIVKLEVNYKWVGRLFGIVWGVTYQTPKGFKPFFPREDLLTDLINLHKDKPEFTESYLRKMAITNFGAGHETLASTLIAIMAMLGTHPEVQATATHEIRCQNAAKSRKPGSNISYADALELVYTRAVIREAMRLYPVISMSLPRVVPLHGSGLQLYGLRIPPGATVGCNPVSLHRNEDICGPDPDKFDPRRWLAGSGTPDTIRALERYSLSWGGGSRTCPGRHLAEMIVLKCVVRLLDRFEVRAAVPPPEDQGPTYFLAMLTGVRASFVPLEKCKMKQR